MRIRIVGFILIIILYFSLQIYWVWASSEEVTLALSNIDKGHYKEISDAKKFIIELLKYENTEDDQCSFPDPQLSPEDDKRMFGFVDFDKCDTPTHLDLKITNKTLIAKCEHGLTPWFAKDYGVNQAFGGQVKHKPKWTRNSFFHPVTEYVIVKCGRSSKHTFVFNKYRKSISDKANKKRFSISPSKDQLSVLFLVFDSVSKYSAFRNWPSVTNFLKNAKNDAELNNLLSVYEFKKPASVKPRTMNNMSIIFYGKFLNEITSLINEKLGDLKSESENFLNVQRKLSIWSHYKSLGYTTMFLMDTVWDYVPSLTGRKIVADHVFVNFWRVAWSVYGWHDFSEGQKCLGTRNSHTVSLNYTLQYFQNYKDNNKFAHVHLDAAHEFSGNVKTVDEPLLEFLKDFISLMNSRNEDFVFFLMGDHGLKRLYRSDFDIRINFEENVPLAYLLVSKNFEKKWDLESKLTHNSDQLLGRFDINLSLKDLAYFPYGLPKETYFSQLKEFYTLNNVTSIFSEYLDPRRNCQDIGVVDVYCLCSKFRELTSYDDIDMDVVVNAIVDLLEEYFRRLSDKHEECQEMKSFDIEEKKVFNIRSKSEGANKIFYVKGFADGKEVEVLANFCSYSKFEFSNAVVNRELYPLTSYKFGKKRYFTQLSSVDVHNTECALDCLC